MNTHDQERLPGDDELAALYRKLPDKLPGAELDAAVLRAAAAAIRPVQRRRPRWLVAIGSAATLVLAAGLAWRMRELPSANQPPALPISSLTSPAATAAAAVPVPTVPAAIPATPVVEAQSVPTPARLSRRAEGIAISQQKSRRSETTGAAMQQPAARPAPAIEMNAAVDAASASPRQLATPPPPQNISSAPIDRVAAKSSPFANQISVPAPAPRPAPPPAPAAPPIAAADVAPAAAPVAGTTEQAPMPYARQLAPMPSAPAIAPPAPAAFTAPPPAPPAPSAVARYAPDPAARQSGDSAEQELARIRLLFSLERGEEGRQRLAAFLRLHPDYPLPADLREQLPSP